MRSWSETLCYWLADSYALATLLLVVAVAALVVLRQPARRLWVSRSAVAGLALLTILTALPGWPQVRWTSWPARRQAARLLVVQASGQEPQQSASVRNEIALESWEVMTAPPSTTPAPQRGEGNHVQGSTGGAAIRVKVDSLPDWSTIAGLVFLVGGSLMLIWLVIGFWQTAAMRRRSRQAPEWLRDALSRVVGDGAALPDLLLSERLSQPVAVGLLRPAIILPDRFVEDEPEHCLSAVLAHEWAHIRNGDLYWLALALTLMPIFFAHPLYWWLRRRIRDDQEILADAAAAAEGRVAYAEALLSWATARPERSALAVAGSVALWEQPSQLKQRIVMLLDRNFRVEPTCPKRWGLGVRGGMAVAVLALSVLTVRPAPVGADPPMPPADPKAESKASSPSESGATIQVLDPDGKPAVGAQVYRSDIVFRSLDRDPMTVVKRADTDATGSFRLTPEDVKAAMDRQAQFVVMAEGYGPAFTDPSVGDGMKVIHLVKDDVPIRGRLLDIQGQPVAGATVQLAGFLWYPFGNLDKWLEALKTEKAFYSVEYKMLRSWASDDLPSLFPAITTDREGRFTLKGVGRERIVSLLISGPRIETRFERVATRDMPTIHVPPYERQDNLSNEITCHGVPFELVPGPGLEAVGTVRDKDTGKPLAGATVQTTALFGNPLRVLKTTTDAEGRYRLSGIPRKTDFGDGQELLAAVKDGPAYLQSVQRLGEALGPITKDFELKRGVWARGRVTDKSTGKPIKARFDYFILEDNPHLKDYPRYGTIRAGMPFEANENGEYKIVVMPGRGILGARLGNDSYRLGVGLEKIKGLKTNQFGAVPTRPQYFFPTNYNTVVEINPKEGEESVTTNIEFDRGRTIKGKLVGPDGESVAGVLMMGAEDHFQAWSNQPLASAEFEVHSLGSENKRALLFYHEGKKLAGAYLIQPDEMGPLTIGLKPCGTLTGRLVDENGAPVAVVQMSCDRYLESGSQLDYGSLPPGLRADEQGRFRVSGLVPGLKYNLRVWQGRGISREPIKDVIIKAGETRDLGDVKLGE
jgi:beta-lactamase regulating signal transducer with metallopeptidase domain